MDAPVFETAARNVVADEQNSNKRERRAQRFLTAENAEHAEGGKRLEKALW